MLLISLLYSTLSVTDYLTLKKIFSTSANKSTLEIFFLSFIRKKKNNPKTKTNTQYPFNLFSWLSSHPKKEKLSRFFFLPWTLELRSFYKDLYLSLHHNSGPYNFCLHVPCACTYMLIFTHSVFPCLSTPMTPCIALPSVIPCFLAVSLMQYC